MFATESKDLFCLYRNTVKAESCLKHRMVLISVTCSVFVTLISQPNVLSSLCSSLSGFLSAVITDVQTGFGCSILLKINVSYIMAGRTDFVRVSYYKV